jgi:kynurenine formamidase
MPLLDLSQPIADGMPVYPGDDAVHLVRHRTLAVDGYTDHRLTAGCHVGTHVDGPMHLTAAEVRIADLPLERFCGRALCLDVRGRDPVTLGVGELALLSPGDRLLLATGFDSRYGSPGYYADHPVVAPALAEALVARGLALLGVDAPSPDRPPFPVHRLLLAAGIPVLENLRGLTALPFGRPFELLALPLRLEADAAPVRAVARLP